MYVNLNIALQTPIRFTNRLRKQPCHFWIVMEPEHSCLTLFFSVGSAFLYSSSISVVQPLWLPMQREATSTQLAIPQLMQYTTLFVHPLTAGRQRDFGADYQHILLSRVCRRLPNLACSKVNVRHCYMAGNTLLHPVRSKPSPAVERNNSTYLLGLNLLLFCMPASVRVLIDVNNNHR